MKKARKDSQALPIKKYDDRSVREIKKELDGLSDKELRKVHEYDLHRRHRSAFISWTAREKDPATPGVWGWRSPATGCTPWVGRTP